MYTLIRLQDTVVTCSLNSYLGVMTVVVVLRHIFLKM